MENNLDELKSIVAPIAIKYGVQRVSIFGSRARGDHSAKSDYDFCIIPRDGMSLIELSGFRLDLVDALGTDVDVLCEKSIKPEFMERISVDKKLIYEVEESR